MTDDHVTVAFRYEVGIMRVWLYSTGDLCDRTAQVPRAKAERWIQGNKNFFRLQLEQRQAYNSAC